MSTTNLDHQIVHYQGDNFVLEFEYVSEDNIPQELLGFSADMFIRRSPLVSTLVCQLNDDFPTGVFGRSNDSDFLEGSGVTGVGGISLNYEGVSGSVHIAIDATTVSNIPAGRHFYDLFITGRDANGFTGASGEVTNILSGTFELAREVTR